MQTNEARAVEAADTDPAPDSADPTARIAELETALLAVRDEQLRERAELDNQRKRLVRDVEQARRFANERLLGEILPVLDNLERGLEASGNEAGRLREGIELTLRQLVKVVEDHGLLAVDPRGQPFDPDLHQAVSVLETAEHPADTVVQVMQKGYTLNGRLLRPALVVVAK